MMLPKKCPKCGGKRTVQRTTYLYGTPQEESILFCTECDYREAC